MGVISKCWLFTKKGGVKKRNLNIDSQRHLEKYEYSRNLEKICVN